MSSIAQIGPVPIPLISRLQQRLEAGVGEIRELLTKLALQSKPEQIHDIRIATRRQRVLCRLLSEVEESPPAVHRLDRSLKKLTRALSSVRSWDVSAQQLKVIERQWRGEGKKGFGFLRTILKKKTQRVRRKYLNRISKDQFYRGLDLQELASFWNLLPAPGVEHAILTGARKSCNKVLKKWEHYQKTRAIDNLHELRICLKKHRYFLEIQADGLGHPDEEKIGQLKSVQDCLGHIHDLHVLQGHLDQKLIRNKIPADKKSRFRRLQKYLKQSLASALVEFRKGEGKQLPSILQGEAL